MLKEKLPLTLPGSFSPARRRAEQAYQARLGPFLFSPVLIMFISSYFIFPFIVAKYTKDFHDFVGLDNKYFGTLSPLINGVLPPSPPSEIPNLHKSKIT